MDDAVENEGMAEGGLDGGPPQLLPVIGTGLILEELTMNSPCPSSSHTDESDQDVRPGFLMLSEDEESLVGRDEVRDEERGEEKEQDQVECEEGTEMEPIESDIEKEGEDGKSQEEKEKEHKGSNKEDEHRESTEGEVETMKSFHSSALVDPPPPCATLPLADEGKEHWGEEPAPQRKRDLSGSVRDEEELKSRKKARLDREEEDGEVDGLEYRSTVEGAREGEAAEKPRVDEVRDEGEVEWLMRKKWIKPVGEEDGEEVEREEKMPTTVDGEELEAHLELPICGSQNSQHRLEKVVQHLVAEQLQLLQLTIFDKSLQELRDRVDKMDYSKHESVVNSLQAGIAQTSNQTTVSTSSPRLSTGAVKATRPSFQQATPVPAPAPALPSSTGYIAALLSGTCTLTPPPVRLASPTKTGAQVNQPFVKPAAPVTAPAGPSKTGTEVNQPFVKRTALPVSAPTGPSKTGTYTTPPSVRPAASSKTSERPAAPLPLSLHHVGSQASKQAAKSPASKVSTQGPVKQSRVIDLTEVEEDDDVVVTGVQNAPVILSAASTPLTGQRTTSAPVQTGTLTAVGKETVRSPGMNTAGGPLHTVHHRPLQGGSPSKNLSSTTTTTTAPTTTTSPSKPFSLPSNVPQLPVLSCALKPLPPAAKGTLLPQQPQLKLARVQDENQNSIALSWSLAKIDQNCAAVDCYYLYAYQQVASASKDSAPSAPSCPWKKLGEVKALPLPMACTLSQFMSGSTYYFAVCARDVYGRCGPFCEPRCTDVVTSIPALVQNVELTKNKQ